MTELKGMAKVADRGMRASEFVGKKVAETRVGKMRSQVSDKVQQKGDDIKFAVREGIRPITLLGRLANSEKLVTLPERRTSVVKDISGKIPDPNDPTKEILDPNSQEGKIQRKINDEATRRAKEVAAQKIAERQAAGNPMSVSEAQILTDSLRTSLMQPDEVATLTKQLRTEFAKGFVHEKKNGNTVNAIEKMIDDKNKGITTGESLDAEWLAIFGEEKKKMDMEKLLKWLETAFMFAVSPTIDAVGVVTDAASLDQK